MRGATGGSSAGITMGSASYASGDRRCVGGHFWALADAVEGEGDEDLDVAAPPSPPSATPSDYICDFLSVGCDEADVAATIDEILPVDDPARVGLSARETTEMVRRIVHRRTAAAAARPWKGPLPKVRLLNLTLFDMIRPDS